MKRETRTGGSERRVRREREDWADLVRSGRGTVRMARRQQTRREIPEARKGRQNPPTSYRREPKQGPTSRPKLAQND